MASRGAPSLIEPRNRWACLSIGLEVRNQKLEASRPRTAGRRKGTLGKTVRSLLSNFTWGLPMFCSNSCKNEVIMRKKDDFKA